ncbi:FAD-dependent oxidoreductase [candidate division WOR-3 bacterium]|nr:FAD-dependent oxidoreductase [candidate division WOR-3 bacterium]
MKFRTDVAIIGGGPAGLSAAHEASAYGMKVDVFDDNFILGGQLIKQTHKFFGSKEHLCGFRGIDIAEILIDNCKKNGVSIHTEACATGIYGNTIGIAYPDSFEEIEAKAIVVATGASENSINFVNNDLPGIYGAGAIQTLMNVFGVKPAKRVLMIGSGNIGLIVSYQLIQAGVEIAAVVEALPRVGGYLVHSAKLRRTGVPILTKHTIVKAEGDGEKGVNAAIVSEIDRNFNPVAGTEKKFEVDSICLAVGLTPLSDLLELAGCRMKIVPELGGKLAVHDEYMTTTRKDVFLCGDVSGIEEAVTATLEGKLAGLSAALSISRERHDEIQKSRESILEQLRIFRDGPFGEKARVGNSKLIGEFINEK